VSDHALAKRPIISCFSRLSEIKGQHVLLEAVRRLQHEVAILIVGGPLFTQEIYERQLKEQAQRLPSNVRVIFTGFQDDVVPWMQASTVVVQPSIVPEGFGRTIVEAQLCGRPVIATDAGPVREIIEHGVTGWIVRADDAAAISEQLDWCIRNPEHSRRVGSAGQASALNRFGLEQSCHRFQSVLQKLLAD
jgi:glycosyltransferase involved in cell wall biosynthesis